MALTYFRNVRSHVKGRWCGRKLGEIVGELGPSARVKGDLGHILQSRDIVEYEIHVHEPPVMPLELPSAILHESDEFIVINKPSGIPVHPTVNYHYHSVTEVMREQYGPLYPCYRLDRLTSGVLVLAKTSQFASKFQNLAKDKTYLARVHVDDLMSYKGQGNIEISYPFGSQGSISTAYDENPGFIWDILKQGAKITFTDPIITFNAKRGYEGFLLDAENEKFARTNARLYDHKGQLATLELKLETGRTHQIRKHLSMNGFPIHNDEIYADGGRLQQLFKTKSKESFNAVWEYAEGVRKAKLTGEKCAECGISLYDSRIAQLDLHCLSYTFDSYSFVASPPF